MSTPDKHSLPLRSVSLFFVSRRQTETETKTDPSSPVSLENQLLSFIGDRENRETDTETERERERDRQREGETETERGREAERDREGERETERGRERGSVR